MNIINSFFSVVLSVISALTPITFDSSMVHAIVTEEESNTVKVFTKCRKSTVMISALKASPDGQSLGLSYGSGVVVDSLGTVATAAHVVDKSGLISVKFFDGTIRSYHISPQRHDQGLDMSILVPDEQSPTSSSGAVSTQVFYPAKFANLDKSRIGHKVIVIGNPRKYEFSCSTGIISGFRTDIVANNHITKLAVQTDAAANPGNSGGPAFNSDGELLGIASFIVSKSGDSAGIAFFISSKDLQYFIEKGQIRP